MSVYDLWERHHIETNHDLSKMTALFLKDAPQTVGFDTETTGLHIKKDKPFLVQFGWLIPKQEGGRVFTFYPTPENMKVFFDLCKRAQYVVAHNIKYDIHMLSNIGYSEEVQNMRNLCENMAVARLALEAVPAREGGDSLQLKSLGVKYVDPSAANSEGVIKAELHRLNLERVQVLAAALKQFDHPTETTFKPVRKDTNKATTVPYATKNPDNVVWKHLPKKWGKGLVEDFLKDPTHDIEDLPEDVREVYEEWLREYPEPTYEDVPRDIMIKYGGEDIITMLEFFKKSFPFIIKREQLPILKLEQECILPVYRMERVGMKADLDYLETSRKKVKNYIKELREKLYALAGEKVNVGQHERLKDIFREKWGIDLSSCDNPALKKIIKTGEGEPKEFATLIKALRSLEKWYSTYIKRIQDLASYDGKVYTQINLNGAVSGRMSSDFQQFPKKALKTLEGEELYHPRKPFTVKGGNYESIVYIDYDQIELVTQAHYTLRVSGGDPNLCRAYMPFRCRHYRTGEFYNYQDPSSRARWNEQQESGESAWLDEEGKPWVKTDVHAETTHKAFPHIPLGTDEFKEWRSKGKIFNFLANYGGGKGAAISTLDLKEEEADALVRGYNEAFPHVRIYQDGIIKAHAKKGYVQNHYGRRYYISDSNRAYKLGNYVVQGTCADALKKAVIELDKFLLDKKTKMVVPIHDEIQFDKHKDEEGIEKELEKIMQEAFDWALVPVTAGIEVTTTNWANKQ
jgi:DNA polymerase I